jgi:hypothetical protein
MLIPETPPQEGGTMQSERDGNRLIYFFSSEGTPAAEEKEFVAAETPPVEPENPTLSLADYQALNDAVGEETNNTPLIPALGARYNDSIRVNESDDVQDADTFDVPVMASPETPIPIAADSPTDPAATDPAIVADSPALDGTAGSNNPDTGAAGTTTQDDLNPEIVDGITSQDNFNAGIVTGDTADTANPETGAARSLPLIVTALAALGSVPVLLRKRK